MKKEKYNLYPDNRAITDIKELLQTSVKRYRDNAAFRQRFVKGQPFGVVTYRQLLEDVNGLGTALLELGLEGKTIGVLGENSYQWASSYLAVLCGVGVVVPFDRDLDYEALRGQVEEANVEAVFCSKRYLPTLQNMKAESLSPLRVLIVLDDSTEEASDCYQWSRLIQQGKEALRHGNQDYIKKEIDREALAVIIYTSGTTGKAKGVMLSHKNLCENLMAAPTLLYLNSHDIFFSVLPLHHTYECTCGMLMPLYKGASVAYCESLKRMAETMQEVRPTMMLAVPLVYENMYRNLKRNLKKEHKEGVVRRAQAFGHLVSKLGGSRMGLNPQKKLLKPIHDSFGGRLRVLISGGSAMKQEVLDYFNDLGIIMVEGYGLTELSPLVALNPDRRHLMKPGAAGRLLPNMEAKVESPGEDGIGELCFKGPNVMLGYYNRPEETSEVLKDGWFYTGDLGYIDDEGFLYITGRKKNVILTSNGKNIFPEELEQYFARSPFIAELMVWENQSKIAATVLPDWEEVLAHLGDHAGQGEVDQLLEEEIDRMNRELPMYKRIGEVKVRREDFAKTTSQKIRRQAEENR